MEEYEDAYMEYNLNNVSCLHRVARINVIENDYSQDNNW